MTDLERLFRLLVQQLAGTDPGRLHRPLTVAELSVDVVPYRHSRRVLALESAEDHEALLLRLVAGEGGFVRLVHDEIRRRFEVEAQSSNPDLGLLREFARAQFLISTEPLAKALGDGLVVVVPPAPPPRPAPPMPPPLPPAQTAEFPVRRPVRPSVDVPLDEVRLSMPELDDIVTRHAAPPPPPPTPDPPVHIRRTTTAPPAQCSFCGGTLPTGRVVNFCPHCGQNQSMGHCPACQAEVDLDWKHCVKCGQALAS
ncbi:MAG TPA: zinc ribbon domain-containing protein [Gemmatimonadales bacterium]|nr:zinc ribbon domain-containing protein [Gemmatimonadales bacterium]